MKQYFKGRQSREKDIVSELVHRLLFCVSIYDFKVNIIEDFDLNIFAILQYRSHLSLVFVICDIFF